MTLMDDAVKFDDNKIRYELLPPEFSREVAEVLTFGAKKYGDRNWEKGMKWSRVYGALKRHIEDWFDPYKPDEDPETGLSHLAHAGCCLAFLMAYDARDMIAYDDRPIGNDAFWDWDKDQKD